MMALKTKTESFSAWLFLLLFMDAAAGYDSSICNCNKTYRIVYNTWSRNVDLKRFDMNESDIESLQGYGIDIFKSFLDKCPIRFELARSSSGDGRDFDWGTVLETGEVTGIIGDIHRGIYDFTLNQFVMREELLPYIFYSQPAKPGQISVITKNDRKSHSAHSYLLIERVFTDGAILLITFVGIFGIISAIVISAIQGTKFTIAMGWDVLYGLLNAANTDPFHTGEGMQLRMKHIQEIIKMGDEAPAEQKKSFIEKLLLDLPLRIFGIAWLLFCFFLITYLSSEIQSRATISKLQHRIGSLDDLVRDTSIQIYWNRYVIDRRFRHYKEGVINQLVVKYDSQAEHKVEFYHPNTTTDLLMRGNTALITLWDSALHEVSEVLIQSCDIHAFIDDYMQLNYGFLFNAGRTDLIGVFNKNIQEMEASGELNKLRRKWFGVPQKCHPTRRADGSGVPLLSADPFIPLAFKSAVMVGVAIVLAVFNRIIWRPKSNEEKMSAPGGGNVVRSEDLV